MELKPNPFMEKGGNISVELTPDVARYFKSSKQVNQYLRNQIKQFQKIMM